MLTPFDYTIIVSANKMAVTTEILYRRVEKHKDYKGYRHRHTDAELIKMLEDTLANFRGHKNVN